MLVEISLNALRFYSHIGVSEQEQIVGQEFEVDLHVYTESNASMEKDNLKGTISYAELYEVVAQIMGNRRKLLESAAIEISNTIRERWQEVVRGEVSIKKCLPPITGMSGNASVKIFFEKISE